MSINGNVAYKELTEGIDQQVVDGWMVAVFDDERHKRSKESIGRRLAIDVLYDARQLHVVFVAECLLEFIWKNSFEESVHQYFAKKGAAAFVAKDVAEWRRMHDDVPSVVKATVGTRSQNTCYARFVSAKSTSRSEQVTFHLNLATGEQILQDTPYRLAERLYATCAIEIDSPFRTLTARTRQFLAGDVGGNLRQQVVI